MPPAPDARKVAFAHFVKRAVDHARIQRGWTPTQIVEAAGQGLSRSTLYRWLRADWQTDPQAAQVVAFCDALDIPPRAAFSILWPGKTDKPPQPEPPPLDPDVVLLLRRLADPNTPEQERYFIRETIRTLAARAGRATPPEISQAG